jgi:hypothetical protein
VPGFEPSYYRLLGFLRRGGDELMERDRHFGGGGDGYIFSPGRLLACSIQEMSWPSVRSSSS